jgi:hypothetical protein
MGVLTNSFVILVVFGSNLQPTVMPADSQFLLDFERQHGLKAVDAF